MKDKIKLIWDFRGPSAKQTAEHHQIHLNDFLVAQNRKTINSGIEELNEFHYIAFIIVDKAEMIFFRDRLKPHRGQIHHQL